MRTERFNASLQTGVVVTPIGAPLRLVLPARFATSEGLDLEPSVLRWLGVVQGDRRESPAKIGEAAAGNPTPMLATYAAAFPV